MFLIFGLKMGVIDETGEEQAVMVKSISSDKFESFGNYLDGHPEIQNPVPGIVFRKNNNCCMLFYQNHIYDPPEFKFKIKIRSFSDISVEDLSSFGEGLRSGRIKLSDEAGILLKNRKEDQTALVTINWTDGQSSHSTVFSFEGNDALKKAAAARGNLLKALT